MLPTVVSVAARKNLEVLEQVENDPNPTADDVRVGLLVCQLVSSIFERNWQQIDSSMNHGIEGRKLAFALKEFRDALALGITLFKNMSNKVQNAPISEPEKKDGIRLLEQSAAHFQKVFDASAMLLRDLELPPAKVDPASLPPGRKEKHVKGFIGSTELFSRMRFGEQIGRMA
jgi:hypothetical protein